MKANKIVILMLAVSALLLLNSCKRHDIDLEQQATHSAEQADSDAEFNEILQNADLIATKSAMKGGREEKIDICGASVNDTSQPGTVILTFDGTTPCSNGTRTRSGVVKMKLENGKLWTTPGAILTVEFVNYKITWLNRGRTHTLNGKKYIKNVTGASIVTATENRTNTVVIHEITGNMSVLFDNGRTSSWNLARQRTTTLNNGRVDVRIVGIGSADGRNNLAAWGVNRFGGNFYTTFTTPILANAVCGWHKPTAGVVMHDGELRDVIVTFGLDASGNAASACPTHFNVQWTKDGASRSKLVAYPN